MQRNIRFATLMTRRHLEHRIGTLRHRLREHHFVQVRVVAPGKDRVRADAVVETDEIQASVRLPDEVDGLEVVERSILTGARFDTGDAPHHRIREESLVQHRRAGEIEVDPERQSVERGEHRNEIVSVVEVESEPWRTLSGPAARFRRAAAGVTPVPRGRRTPLSRRAATPVHRHGQNRSQHAQSAGMPQSIIKLDPRDHFTIAPERSRSSFARRTMKRSERSWLDPDIAR